MTDPILFGASWDQKLTTGTIIASALLIVVPAVIVWLAATRPMPPPARYLVMASAIIPLVVLIAGVLTGPRGYSVHSDRIRVERPLFPIDIPLASIREVSPLSPDSLSGSTRTLGSGGFFGYFGRFRNQELGDYRMYATRGEGHVLILTDRPYVLTPDDPDRFVKLVEKRRAEGMGG